MKKVAFPGFGLEFELNSTALTVFGIDIQWYGIIISLGIISAFALFYYYGVKKEKIDPDSIYNITLIAVPLAVVGARAFYVVSEWENYKGRGFYEIINIRGGGLAIYGGIIFGLIAVILYNKYKKTNSLSMLDALAPAVMLGQAIGRWGNFMNVEAYGWSENAKNLPWRMWIERVVVNDRVLVGEHFVHPTFLYESLWNLLGLVLILTLLYPRKKFDGQVLFAYLGWYGFGRALIESLRADSLYIVDGLKLSVVIGVSCVVASIIGEFVLYRKYKEEQKELQSYASSLASVIEEIKKEDDVLAEANFESSASEADAPCESEADMEQGVSEIEDAEKTINNTDFETEE